MPDIQDFLAPAILAARMLANYFLYTQGNGNQVIYFTSCFVATTTNFVSQVIIIIFWGGGGNDISTYSLDLGGIIGWTAWFCLLI